MTAPFDAAIILFWDEIACAKAIRLGLTRDLQQVGRFPLRLEDAGYFGCDLGAKLNVLSVGGSVVVE